MTWNPPQACPVGHPITGLGWVPCECARATGAPKGHEELRCGTCERVRRSGGCDELVDHFPPRRRGTGNPGDDGYPG